MRHFTGANNDKGNKMNTTETYAMVIPVEVRNLVTALIERFEGILALGKAVPPIFYIGNTEEKIVEMVFLDTDSPQSKAMSANHAREVAYEMNADFVVATSESWSLPKDMFKNINAVIEQYGSISACPERIDVVSILVETRGAVALGTAPVSAVPKSKNGRKVGRFDWFAGKTPLYQLCGNIDRILPVQ